MSLLTPNTALILIDVQEGIDDPSLGRRSNPDAESNMARLLAEWRTHGRPIFHIQHMSVQPNSPLRPDKPGNAIKQIVAPQGDEPVITKTVNNAFVGTDLESRLREATINSVVIVGLTAEHCVSTTARMAGDLGFTTMVVADATASHEHQGYDGMHYSAELVQTISIVSLQDEFATVVMTDELLNAE
jgi:nicotinamidase-related amidase